MPLALIVLALIASLAGALAAPAPAPGAQNPPPAPAPASESETSFMDVPIGTTVRVSCTAPAMEFNNATLLAVTKSNITIASAKGERFNLPRETTTIEAPVTWERTAAVGGDPAQTESKKGGRGLLWVLLLLAGAAAVAGFMISRRRDAEAAKQAQPMRLGPRMAPESEPEPAAAPPPRPESADNSIEGLIENRCFGTALEQLDEQVKLRPDEFKLRLQLLKVYLAVSDRKQADRVLRQIQLHPGFSAEQKEEAAKILPPPPKK